MSTSICFDFGNTRLKAAIFINTALVELRVLETGNVQEIENLLQEFTPAKTILSSVIHHDKAIESLLAKKTALTWIQFSNILVYDRPINNIKSIII